VKVQILRVGKYLIATVVIMPIALSSALIIGRTWIAEQAIALLGNQGGIGPVSLTVSHLDLSSIEIKNIAAARGQIAIERLDLTYDWHNLLEGRADTLAISGGHVTLNLSANGFEIPGASLQPQDERSETAAVTFVPVIPFTRFTGERLSLTLNSTFGEFLILADGSLERSDEGWAGMIAAEAEGLGAAAQAKWSGLINPLKPELSSGQGELLFSASSPKQLPLDIETQARGHIKFDMHEGQTAIQMLDPLVFNFASLPTELTSSLPNEYRALLSEPFEVSVSQDSGTDFLHLVSTGDTFAASMNVSSSVEFKDARATFNLSGKSDSIIGIDVSAFKVTAEAQIENFPALGGVVDATLTAANFGWPVAGSSIPLEIAATLSSVQSGAIHADKIRAKFTTGVLIGANSIKVSPNTGMLTASGLGNSDGISIQDTVTLNLLPPVMENAHNITFLYPNDTPSRLSLNVGLSVSPINFSIMSGDTDLNVLAHVPNVSLSGEISEAGGPMRLDLKVHNSKIEHELLSIDDLKFSALAQNNEIDGVLDFRILRIGNVEFVSDAQQPDIRSVSVFNASPDRIVINGGLQASNRSRFAAISGTINPDFISGALDFNVDDISLGTGGAITASMLSAFATVTDLTGTVGASGRFEWNDKTTVSSGTARIEDVGIETSSVRVSGINSIATLSSIWPLRSQSPQKFSISEVYFGMPLQNIEVELDFQEDDQVTLRSLEADIAGGAISTQNVSFSLSNPNGNLTLNVENIDLSALVSILDVEGLLVSGYLTGEIPIEFSAEAIVLHNGQLSSTSPGFIKYRPSESQGGLAMGGGNLLFQALENFNYDRLKLTAKGDVFQDLDILMAFYGSNPNLYDGYPVEFNMNVNGRFLEMVQQGLAGYRIQGNLRRNLSQ